MSEYKRLDKTGLNYFASSLKTEVQKMINEEGGGATVEISSTPIVEGDDIATPIYYYQPSSSPSGQDTKDEKLYLQNSNGKAVEVPFLSKDVQTVSLSSNSIYLAPREVKNITATGIGVITAKSLNTDSVIVSVNGNNVSVTGVWQGQESEASIIITANSTQSNSSASAVVVIYKTLVGYAITPSFNPSNFASLDTTATRKYYFGQYGNAFYGVSDGSVTAVPGGVKPDNPNYDLGQASGEVPYWELVDTDGKINNSQIQSTWSNGINNNGQTILNYTNNLKNTFFKLADLEAVKHAGKDIKTNDIINGVSQMIGEGSISYTDAYMWPLSVTQLTSNPTLASVLCNNSGIGYPPSIWTRSYSYYYYYKTASSFAYIARGGTITDNSVTQNYSINPAFNLNLDKVLLSKTALSDQTDSSFTDISIKIQEDVKFLINSGTSKSDFIINLEGDYTVTEITSLNSGTNYISYIIYDPETDISLYYGNIKTLTETAGNINLTDLITSFTLNPGTYTMAIFQEEKCDAYKTDYASNPTYFTFTISE